MPLETLLDCHINGANNMLWSLSYAVVFLFSGLRFFITSYPGIPLVACK